MKRRFWIWAGLMLVAVGQSSGAAEPEKDVSWRATAEIARRGAMVERVAGLEEASDAAQAAASALQPPPDDSHKWLLTLVTTRNCPWCEQARRDFDADPKLKAWVDTKDYTRSWAHWQVVQIEDQSQAWRWKDFRPTSFPALIVQPPVNGSWGDPHTIVFARQGYAQPSELDAALRKAIQLYAAKTIPQRRQWEARQLLTTKRDVTPQQAATGGHRQAGSGEQGGGWNPPVAPPAPLPPLPAVPSYPVVPPAYPAPLPEVGALLTQLVVAVFGGPALANFLLLAILAWQVYRGVARREGIPLLVDDDTAARVVELLQSLPELRNQAQTTPRQNPLPNA